MANLETIDKKLESIETHLIVISTNINDGIEKLLSIFEKSDKRAEEKHELFTEFFKLISERMPSE